MLESGKDIVRAQRELNLTVREYNAAHGFASVSAHAARIPENRLKARNLDQDLRKEIAAGKSTSASVSIVEKPKYSSPDKTIKAAKAAVALCDSLSGDALAKQQERVRELLETIEQQNAEQLDKLNKAVASKSARSTRNAGSKSHGQASSPHPKKRERGECAADDCVPRVAEHSLNIRKDAKPVRQPLRRFAEDRRKIIGEEVTKLLVAGFIVEVLHTEWLANPVLVEKKQEENMEAKAPKVWRMCIDYTNLNKACPKDPFPLPRIDQVIDSTAGFVPEETMLVDNMEIDTPVFLVRETPSWVKPIKEFLINDTLPDDENESRRIQRRSKAYTFINGEVYKRSVTGVLQRCVEPKEGKEMLEEIHQGECGHHASSRALVAKVFRHGFYWPTTLENAEDLVRKCNGCQRYAKQNHTPASGLKTIPLTWPFAVWCLDMVGPFKTARSSMTHILVMVDKFTKWLEVKPIAKCDGHTAVKFLKDVILRYGYPHSIITDNGTNFAQGEFKRFYEDNNIRLDLCSVA
ncbi:hypothetical protein QYE76_024348 [Lolium multiflorum]|uniref:Integrase catalytic domain-containing protein n=1 Tax=Lolium multiflorum TaxID=4521 RepID=A0AAD8VV05_LOLMU|nr:hypothetical protein QYE76_024348 [Lolium multiflorum]